MKEHIIRAILYQDMSVKWKDAELNGDVNVHLNVHQKTRQFVEVELDDFLLSDGEAVLASFEKTVDGEIYHENPTKMDNVEGERRVFRLQIPTLVHNTPGEWGVQFFVVTDYDPITGNYAEAYPFNQAKFSEHSSFIDDGLTVPTGENLSALYAEVKTAETNAVRSAEQAKEYAEQANAEQVNAHLSAVQALEDAERAAEHEEIAKTAAATAAAGATEAAASASEAKTVRDELVEKTGIFLHYDDEGYPCWYDAEDEE